MVKPWLDSMRQKETEKSTKMAAEMNSDAHHVLARRRQLPFSAMAEHGFVVREQGSGTRAALEKALVQTGRSISTAALTTAESTTAS